jgi:trigger factor
MRTSTEQLEPTKVRLHVEVEPARVSEAFDAAAKHIAQHVQLPGFRKGKVPRKLLEARIGKGALAQQALEDAVGTYYAEAVQAEELRVVAPPEIDMQNFDEDEGCTFEATVEIRPDIELPPHEGIDVTFPEWDVTDEEVEEQLDQLRERFAELEEVDRPASTGDYVTIDLAASKDGEPIEEATASDALYEVGSGGVTPQLDEELDGAEAGQSLTYTDILPEGYPVHPGEEVGFTVTVHDVRAKQLPELDDDFALTASEFDTIEELEADIRTSLARQKLNHARQELRARVLEAYLALVDVPLPEAMVESEREGRMEQLEQQAERYGLELEELLELQGQALEEITGQLSQQAVQSVKAQLVLETLAEELELTVESEDLSQEVQRHAQRHGADPRDIARLINEQGSVGVLVGDVARRKALDALVASADITGEPSDDELAEYGLDEPTADAEAPSEDPPGVPPPEDHAETAEADEVPADEPAEPGPPQLDETDEPPVAEASRGE